MRTSNFTIILILLIAAAGIAQVKYTWTGGSGSWQTASNWNPSGVPGIADTAVINSGTLTNDQSVTVAGLFQNGGTINGTGNISITANFIWGSGIHGGTGTTTISSSGIGELAQVFGKTLSRTLTIEGSLTITGAGGLTFSTGAQIINNGTMDVQTNTSVGNTSGSIVNNGTFIRSTSTGSATIASPFANNGTISVQTGTLVSSSTLTGSGTFNISPSTVFNINSGTSTIGGNTITGGGIFDVTAGTLNFSGNDVVVANGTTFKQLGAIGGDGNLLINGNFIWEAGTHGGTGTTTISSSGIGELAQVFGKTLSRTLTIEGSLTITGVGGLTFSTGAQIINNGTMDVQTNTSVGNTSGSIVNNGTFIRSTSTGSATIASPFANNGTISVQTGTLVSSSTLTGSGTFNISPSTVFNINSGTSTIGGNTITGGGIFDVTAGTLNFSGNDVVVANGTTFKQLGAIGGDGNLLINGNFIWEAGTHGGTGTTTISSSGIGELAQVFGKTLSRTLTIEGSLTITGVGGLTFSTGAQIINNGTMDVQTNTSVGNTSGSIVNNGTFIRSTETGSATIASPFSNNGTISVLTGTLSFSDTLKNNLTAEIKGVGTLTTPTSNRFINNGTVAPGLSAGILRINGNYPQTSNASLNIEIGGYVVGTERDSLSVSQQAQLEGTLNIQFTNAFLPQIGDVFTIMSYGSRSGQFAQINLSNNVSAQAQYLANGLQIQITSGGSNLPPSAPVLLSPADNDTVSLSSPISFLWNSSTDPDNDPITYALRIFGSGVDTTIAGLSDTTLQFNGSGTLQPGNAYQWNVTASDGNLSAESATWNFFVSSPTNIDDEQIANMIPTEYSLSQNYPNPFNPSTTIRYSVPSRSTVVLKIYDILGGEVSTLVNEEKQPGIYEVNFSASDLSSGMYLYRVQAGDFVETKKMILLR
jgi:hypothetical protein